MSEEVERKMKEAKSLHQKYVQMIEEYTLKENTKNEDFSRRIMKVYNCMIVNTMKSIKRLDFCINNIF